MVKVRHGPVLDVFVIVASYLMLTATVASAATVRIYSGGAPISDVPFSPGNLVDTDISLSNGNLLFSAVNGTPATIEGIWLYKCRNKNPYECMASSVVVVESFPGNADASYSWGDVSAGSPVETANLLYFVKLNRNGKTIWETFWTSVRKEYGSVTVIDEDVSNIEVHLSDGMDRKTVIDFIKNFLMIPANPGWVEKVVIQGAHTVYEISMTGENDIVVQPNTAGYQVHESYEIYYDEIGLLTGDYGFLFPEFSNVKNAITLFSNPSSTCGMFGCESDKGETSGNCCLDCGCETGYYCDGENGCRLKSGIGLGLFGSPGTNVTNCNQEHVISMPVEILNPPSSYTLSNILYKLGGLYNPTTCESSDDIHVCEVVVPDAPDCGSSEFRLSDNSIKFTINYNDGDVPTSKVLETGFPDVTVGSFTCGNGECETGLGETWEECCYDCGCPSGYCDYEILEGHVSSTCRPDLSESSIKIESMSPSHLYTYKPGERIRTNIVLSNKPATLSVSGISCSMGCNDGFGSCVSSCPVSWKEETSADPDKYNMSVTMSLSVVGYSPLRDYIFSPELTFDIEYENGREGLVEKSIVKRLSQISIGAHFCGDGVCGNDENRNNCCYDCPCETGMYCDTANIGGPTEGDSCRFRDFSLRVDDIGSLSLEDSSVEQTIPLSMTIKNYPSGTEVTSACLLEEGSVACIVLCIPVRSVSSADYSLDCMIVIPPVDYVISPYFDPVAREIRLSNNKLVVDVLFNNGYIKDVATYEKDLGDIVIDVTSHCGEGSGDPFMMCESWLDEDENTCCRDCGCSSFGDDYFCYQGADLDGECVDNETIDIRIEGFEPEQPECLVGKFGGNCTYAWAHNANVFVINSPPDLGVVKASYSLDGGETVDIDCLPRLTYGGWDCPFTPDPIPPSEWDALEKSFEIFLDVSYEINGTPVLGEYWAEAEFATVKTEADMLVSCKRQIELLEDEMAKIGENQDKYELIGKIVMYTGYIMIAVGITMCIVSTCGHTALYFIATGAMGVIFGKMFRMMAPDLDSQKEAIAVLIEDAKARCSSEEFESSAFLTHSTMPMPGVDYPVY